VAKVIIEYEAQAASLKAVTDTIINANKAIGDSAEAAAKEGADAYKAMGKSMASAFSSQEVSKALNSNIANINKNRDALNKLTAESIKFSKAAISYGKVVKESAAETLKAKEALAKYQKTLSDTGKGTDGTEKKTQSLKSRLRELKEQLQQLESAGQDGTEAFQKLAIEAGKLQDQISDTQERIRVLASDTFKFDAALGAVKGLAAGFAVAQGAAALFGRENEDLQKTIAKTQGALALLTGLQEIANIVTGQGEAKLAVLNILQKVNAASVRQSAVSYNILGASVKFSAQTLNILKGAIAATGIGLLVVGLGYLFDKLKDTSEATLKAAEDAKALQDAYDSLASAGATAQNELANAQVNLLVANGKLSKSAGENIIAFNERGAAIKKVNEDLKKSETELYDNFNKLQAERRKDGTLTALTLIDDEKNLFEQIKSLNLTSQDQIKTIEVQAEVDSKNRAKENANTIANERLKIAQQGVLKTTAIEGDSLKNKIALLKSNAAIEKQEAKASITNEELKLATIARINAELSRDIQQAKLDESKRLISIELKRLETLKTQGDTSLANELALVDKRADVAKKEAEASIKDKQELQAVIDSIDANAIAEKKTLSNAAIIAEKELSVQVLELRKAQGEVSLKLTEEIINADANARKEALILNAKTDIEAQKKLKNDLALIDAETESKITQARAEEANKRIDIANAEAEAAVTLGTSTYEQRVKLIEDEGQKQKNSLDKKLLGEEAYNAAIIKINADTTAKLNAEQQARIDKAFEYLDAVANVFGEINALSQQLTDNRIQQITESSEAELEAINNSNALETEKARNRAALEKRTARIIAEEKRKQAVADKALAVFEIGLSTARGIMAALAGPPPNPPLAAFIGIAGAIQLAAALAKPIPKFEKGGEIGGKRHNEGGTIVEAEQGEYIVNRKQTSAHRRELNALNQSSDAFKRLINDRYVRPAIMNYMLGSKSKEVGVNVNATLNSKTMESELKGLRKDLRNNSQVFINNTNDSRYLWHKN